MNCQDLTTEKGTELLVENKYDLPYLAEFVFGPRLG